MMKDDCQANESVHHLTRLPFWGGNIWNRPSQLEAWITRTHSHHPAMKAHLLLWSKWNLAPSDQYRPDHVLAFSIVCAHCQATLYFVSLAFSAPTYNWDHATLVFLWRVTGWGVNYRASPSCWATSVRSHRSVCFSLLQLSEEELSHQPHETVARLNWATWTEWPDSAWHMGCVPKQLVTVTTLVQVLMSLSYTSFLSRILPWTSSASISVKGHHNCICLSLGFYCWEENTMTLATLR